MSRRDDRARGRMSPALYGACGGVIAFAIAYPALFVLPMPRSAGGRVAFGVALVALIGLALGALAVVGR